MAEPNEPITRLPAIAAPGEEDDVVAVEPGKVRDLTPHERRLRSERNALRQQLAEARAAAEGARAEAAAEANARIIRAEVKAAAVKLGAHDPADVLKLIDTSTLTFGEDGEVAGVEALLVEVKAAKPWAFSAPSATGKPPGPTTSSTARPPAPGSTALRSIRDLTETERKAELRRFGIRL